MKSLRLFLLVLLAVSSAYAATPPKETFLLVNGPITVNDVLTQVATMTVSSGSQLIQITVQWSGSSQQGQVDCSVQKANNVTVIGNVPAWVNIANTGSGAEMVLQGKGNFGPIGTLTLYCFTAQSGQTAIIDQISLSALSVTQ